MVIFYKQNLKFEIPTQDPISQGMWILLSSWKVCKDTNASCGFSCFFLVVKENWFTCALWYLTVILDWDSYTLVLNLMKLCKANQQFPLLNINSIAALNNIQFVHLITRMSLGDLFSWHLIWYSTFATTVPFTSDLVLHLSVVAARASQELACVSSSCSSRSACTNAMFYIINRKLVKIMYQIISWFQVWTTSMQVVMFDKLLHIALSLLRQLRLLYLFSIRLLCVVVHPFCVIEFSTLTLMWVCQ